MFISSRKLSKTLLLVLYICIMILFEFVLRIDTNKSLNTIAFFATVQLILSILIISKYDKRLLSFMNIFIIISFLFHLSHIVLIWFGNDTVAGYDMRVYTSDFYYYAAMIFCIRIHTFLLFGMLLGNKYTREVISGDIKHGNVLDEREENITLCALYYTGIALIFIGLFPKLYIDFNKFILYVQGSYLSTYNYIFSGALVIIASLPNIGVILMIIGKHKNIRFCNKVMVIVLIYNIMYMVTGNRGEGVTTIIVLLFVYYSIVKKIKFKNMIVVMVCGYVFLSFLTFIADTRHFTDKNLSIMLEALFNSFFNKSPIVSALAEFGASIKTVFYSIEFFPTLKGHTYGFNYIKSILVVFPNIGGLIYKLVNELTFIYYFPNHQVMGGSYIGEMYYAAGNFGVIFAFIIGVIIGKLNNLYNSSIYQKKWINNALCIVVFISMLWWIRDYFYVMVRQIIWVNTLIVLLYSAFKKKLKRKL